LTAPMPELIDVACPACGHQVAVTFMEPSEQPLATGGWPSSAEAARAMARLPLAFVRCVDCGHVFNQAFDYARIPYSAKPYRMYNAGLHWSAFMTGILDRLAGFLPQNPTVIEIGHGDGGFLAELAARVGAGTWIGFDPNGALGRHGAVEYRNAMFRPMSDLSALIPDLIITRHVLEHLTNPLRFLQTVGLAATAAGQAPLFYLEVPCIDRAIETRRSVDFYFEHGSHFTTRSFGRMLERAGAEVIEIGHGYDREVVFSLGRLAGDPRQIAFAQAAEAFRTRNSQALDHIPAQLAALAASGQRVAIWGGTGKSAAFINRYGVDAHRFPIVIDSDAGKAGEFVPGTGQVIRTRDWLKENPVDVVIAPPQWRARDIIAEMETAGLPPVQILIEHDGALIDFRADPHPYRR
jgi:hypothetical protein